MSMFCYQCEQTAGGRGCEKHGVCGKDEATALLQDLLVYAVKGIGWYAVRARALGAKTPEADRFAVEALLGSAGLCGKRNRLVRSEGARPRRENAGSGPLYG